MWALELLLVLKRDPERHWPPDDLVRELRASTLLVNDNLQRFERGGLVMRDEADRYRYAPANALLAELADALDAAYRERPVSIINLISRPQDPVQGLADAFRFKGDKP